MPYFADSEAISQQKVHNIEIFPAQSWLKMVAILESINYTFPPMLMQVRDSDPRNMIGPVLSEHYKQMNYEVLNDIYKIADYMKLRPLCRSIAIYLACSLLIPLNLRSFN